MIRFQFVFYKFDYLVHRIGRTGRRGVGGLATTFINKTCGKSFEKNSLVLLFVVLLDEAILLDLKHLLIEAKQPVPQFLLQLESDKERLLDIGGKKKPSFTFRVYIIYDFR